MKQLRDSLLVRFSVVSLVVLAGVAASIVIFVSDRIKTNAFDDVVDHVTLDTRVLALGALDAADFEGPMAGERLEEFDGFVRSTLLSELTAMVKVWSVDGTLVYSSDPGDIEADPLRGPHLPTALSGTVSTHIHPADGSDPASPRGNDLIEVYSPILSPGTTDVVGAFEIYEYHAPTAHRIGEMRNWVFLVTGLGFLVLYGTLVAFVWGASRTIGRQRAALVDANVELESRVEARAAEITELYREREAAADEKAVVDEVARIVTSTLDIDQIYEKLATEVKKLMDFDRIVLNVIGDEADSYIVKYVSGVHVGGRKVGSVVPIEGTMVEQVPRYGRPFLRQDFGASNAFPLDPERVRAGLSSNIVVPLTTKGRTMGTLGLLSRRVSAYGPKEQAVLERLADLIAPAVENARLFETLRDSEERHRSVVETSPNAVVCIDSDGIIVAWNPAARAMFGYAEQEALGKPFDILIPDSYRSAYWKALERLKAGNEPRSIGLARELGALRRDGSEFSVELSLAEWETHDGKFYTGIMRDITERKQLEEQLVQARKMEVVGQLAGGVAHDFNNLLTPIIGYSALGIDELSQDHPVHRYLGQIQQSAERGADLVRQLLGFARRQLVQPRVLNLNGQVIDTEKMLRRLIGEDIDLVCQLEPDLGLVKVDAGQIEQVLVNLSVNARDAMPDGGRLTIATANVALDAGSIPEATGLASGRYIKLSVGDTGAGMSEEVRSHLFEPFFTTKGVGEGTGLGLATCYGIVKQCGGEIHALSEPSQGTTFEIYLPRLDREVTPVADDGEPDELSAGKETVLLVEDEPAVRRLGAEVLRRQGYMVLEAANGQEALQVTQEGGRHRIDLLLTDVVMSRMGGRELADRLRPLMPKMKVLFTSGFPHQGPSPGDGTEHDIAFMPKPFTPVELIRRVREVLDPSQQSTE